MAHHHHHDLEKKAKDFFIVPSVSLRGGIALCVVIGILSLIIGAFSTSPKHVWGAVLLNTFFFYSIALGGVAFSAMQDVVDAVWARPIKRLHESFAGFLPFGSLILIIFLVCVALEIGSAHQVYSWIADEEMIHHVHAMYGKNIWLNKNFMVIRNIAAILIVLGLSFWQLQWGIKRDQAMVAGDSDKARNLGKAAREKLKYWSAPTLIVYALCFSLLAFDLIMTLSPLWFSTLWAAWMFAIMMQVLCASTLIFMFAMEGTSIGNMLTRQQFHDVGKLMHGFTIFFAYLTYAHVLTYWYGNVPEETLYFLPRIDPKAPWLVYVLIVPVLAFLLPFFSLIFKSAKWTKYITIPLCIAIIVAQWITTMITVIPEVVDSKAWSGPIIELGVFFGLAGVFLASLMMFARRIPMVPVADPLLPKAYNHH